MYQLEMSILGTRTKIIELPVSSKGWLRLCKGYRCLCAVGFFRLEDSPTAVLVFATRDLLPVER